MPNAKGTYYERKLVQYLWELGFGVIRAPSSGSSPISLPDIVAGNGRVYYAIEVKMRRKLPLYIRREQIEELIDFSKRFGAKAIIAVKLPYCSWRFIPVDILSEKGKYFKIGKKEYYSGMEELSIF